MLQVVDVPKILIFSANHNKPLRYELRTYAEKKYPGAMIFARANVAVLAADLEKADVIIATKADAAILDMYKAKGFKVDLYKPPEAQPSPIPVKQAEVPEAPKAPEEQPKAAASEPAPVPKIKKIKKPPRE